MLIHFQVLRQKSQLTEQFKKSEANPEYRELRAEYLDSCDRLVEEIQDLERHVNFGVMWLIADVFKESAEPLERLVKMAMTGNKVNVTGQVPEKYIKIKRH